VSVLALLLPMDTAAQDCSPRPPVRLSTSSDGANRLYVSATAGVGTITGVTFEGATRNVASPAAYQIEIGGQTRSAPTSYAPTTPTAQVQFAILNPGVAAFTVPMVIVDGCGPWKTFVGAGAGGLLPKPTPTPPVTPAGSVAWSVPSLAVSVVPGTSVTRTVTFTATTPLSSGDLVVSPELQPFVQLAVSTLTGVPAGASVRTGLTVTAAVGVSPGLRRGTLTVREGIQSFQPALPIDLTVIQPSAGTTPEGLSMPTVDRVVIPAHGPAYVGDQVLIGVRPGTSATRVDQIAASVGAVVVGKHSGLNWYQLRLGAGSPSLGLNDAIAQLQGVAEVTMAVRSVFMEAALKITPTDPKFDSWDEALPDGNNWAYEMARLPSAWGLSYGSRKVKVGVLDGGFQLDHEDLALNLDLAHSSTPWPNLYSGGGENDLSHGTSVAGVVGGVANNGRGYSGVAWEVTLLARAPSRVELPLGLARGTIETTAANLVSVVSDGATIVTAGVGVHYDLSAEAWKEAEPFRQAFRTLRQQGKDVLFVVSAGNDSDDVARTVPALLAHETEFPNVMAVAAVRRCNQEGCNSYPFRADFSNYGAGISIAAPGESIPAPISTCGLVTYLRGACAKNTYSNGVTGTSFAAPMVAGVAVLLQDRAEKVGLPPLTAAQLKDLLIAGARGGEYPFPRIICRSRSALGTDTECGPTEGIPVLNAYESLLLVRKDRMQRGSIAPGNVQGNNDSYGASISDNGRYVAFETRATNLVPGTTGRTDIYSSVLVKDMLTGELDWISDPNRSLQPPIAAAEPGEDLQPSDVLLKAGPDVSGGAVQQVLPPQYRAWSPTISADGRYVAFMEDVYATPASRFSIVVKDRQTGAFQVFSLGDTIYPNSGVADPNVQLDNRRSPRLAMSADASTFAYEHLVNGSTLTIFTLKRATGQITNQSARLPQGVSPISVGQHALSADGSRMVIDCQVELGELVFGQTVCAINTNTGAVVQVPSAQAGMIHHWPAISPDGQHVSSYDDIPFFDNGQTVLVLNRRYADSTVFTEHPTGIINDPPNMWVRHHNAYEAPMDEHGTLVVFHDGELPSGRRQPVTIKSLPNGPVEPVDVRTDGTPNGCSAPSSSPYAGAEVFGVVRAPEPELGISRDGRFVVFTAYDMQVVDGDTNGKRDVFVVDRNIPYAALKAPLPCR
jgi:subtilisin family serine protease